MLASYLLDSTRTGHPLEPAALEHLSYKALTEEDVCGRGAKAMSLAGVPPEALLNYAGERADLALQLANRLTPMLTSDGLDARAIGTSSGRSSRCSRGWSRRASGSTPRPWPRSRSRVERELADTQRADLRDRGRGLQHQLAAAALEDSVRQAAAAGAQAEREDADRVDRG